MVIHFFSSFSLTLKLDLKTIGHEEFLMKVRPDRDVRAIPCLRFILNYMHILLHDPCAT